MPVRSGRYLPAEKAPYETGLFLTLQEALLNLHIFLRYQ